MINLSPTTDNRTFVLTERVDVGPGYNLLALARTEEELANLAISMAESWWRGAIPVAISIAESRGCR